MSPDEPWTGAGATALPVIGALVVGRALAVGDGDPFATAFYVVKYGLLLAGLGQAYAGYWLHVKRLQARGAAIGFLVTVGAAVVLWGPATVVDRWIPVGVAALVAAGIGAELVVALHRLFVAVNGFLVGVVLGVVFLTPGLEVVDPAVLASGLVMAVVAGVLHVVFVVVSTSVTGGAFVTVALLLRRADPLAVFDLVVSGQLPRGPLLAGAFVAVTGVAVQLASHYGGLVEGPSTGGAAIHAPDDDSETDAAAHDDDDEHLGIR